MQSVRIVVGDWVHDIEVPDEWLDGRRGWELIGSRCFDAHLTAGGAGVLGDEQAVPGVRDADAADPLPTVRAGKAAKKER